ncbi:MAG: amidase family protein [bacterium]
MTFATAQRRQPATELIYRTATELASMIRQRQVSAAEVVEAHLEQIGRHNERLNSIVTLDSDRARQRAAEADADLARGRLWGPLHGVPVTIKDAFETSGLRTTSSHRPLLEYLPKTDATPVARLRQAGAIILGKTNMPELAMDLQSNSPLFGPARNPWDATRTPGGSTGGGAAAVAAGFSPLELGSDIGGSIRIPSHFCGVLGCKPTEHLVSSAGHIPELPGQLRTTRHLGVFGPLARSLEDLRLALVLMSGSDGRDWEVPPVSLVEQPVPDLADLRIAWTDDFAGVPVSGETRTMLSDLADRLSNVGCRVERSSPVDFDFEAAWQTYGEILGAEVGFNVSRALRAASRLVGPIIFRKVPLYRAINRGVTLGLRDYMSALVRRDSLIAALERFLSKWDAWICPVASTPAFTHRSSGLPRSTRPIDVDGRELEYYTATMSYATPFNLTGSPVIILPVALTHDGMPIAVQVVGRRWQDMGLLAAASRLQEVTGPFRRPPGY